ncbi:hypothetical protein OQA88_6618 [Cercophora sp. LCS_1]
MKRDEYTSLFNLHNGPYNQTLAAAASSSSPSLPSSSSVWSQNSDDGNSTTPESDHGDSYCFSSQSVASSQSSVSSVESACGPIDACKESVVEFQPKPTLEQIQTELPRELRLNPRRSFSVNTRSGRPPVLVRQTERKHHFVDNLVDSSTHIVEAIWPTSSVVTRDEKGANTVLPLRAFIQETLRRSRTSYSTLQVALYYLILIKPHVPDRDFTMEQPNDCHASQALQCGRRMFLAALILASKYLQDRNYSARAWSKISGLQTHEINQFEMAFLLAVNWKLHITEEVYSRWTDCVNKFQPPQPPAAGEAAQQLYERQCEEFRAVISALTPELDNVDTLDVMLPLQTHASSSRSLYTPFSERTCVFGDGGPAVRSKASSNGAPAVMEPSPSTVYTPGRFAPALGLLPTPRLTPQASGFNTPAVGAASMLLHKTSMSLAMAQVSYSASNQALDRWPPSATQSPQYHFTRRSSLANSVSTASSPESMVSDSSRLSRSSSISSASSVSAPSAKLDVLARCRYAKQCSERSSMKPTFAPVPEDYQTDCLVASPESYTGPVSDPFARSRREQEMAEAAWALQELQTGIGKPAPTQIRSGTKRGRTASIDNSLQDNVRDMLSGRYQSNEVWSGTLVRARSEYVSSQQVPISANAQGSHKRLCCSTEAAEPFMMSSLHPAMGGVGGPGMWQGILQ